MLVDWDVFRLLLMKLNGDSVCILAFHSKSKCEIAAVAMAYLLFLVCTMAYLRCELRSSYLICLHLFLNFAVEMQLPLCVPWHSMHAGSHSWNGFCFKVCVLSIAVSPCSREIHAFPITVLVRMSIATRLLMQVEFYECSDAGWVLRTLYETYMHRTTTPDV